MTARASLRNGAVEVQHRPGGVRLVVSCAIVEDGIIAGMETLDSAMTPGEARELARLLTGAAAEADGAS